MNPYQLGRYHAQCLSNDFPDNLKPALKRAQRGRMRFFTRYVHWHKRRYLDGFISGLEWELNQRDDPSVPGAATNEHAASRPASNGLLASRPGGLGTATLGTGPDVGMAVAEAVRRAVRVGRSAATEPAELRRRVRAEVVARFANVFPSDADWLTEVCAIVERAFAEAMAEPIEGR